MRNIRATILHASRTRPSQLAARVRLALKRRLAVVFAGWLGVRRSKRAPELSPHPPRPLFQPRRELVGGEPTDPQLSFLNLERPLKFPIDWHPIEGAADPRLELLHMHAMEWAEALDDQRFCDAVLDWIAHVLPYGCAYWRGGWNAGALSIRTVVWMQQISLRTRRMPREFVDAAARSIAEQIRFLEHNLELDLGGHHLLRNAKALLWAGRFFEGREAERWTVLGTRLLERAAAEQFLADGMHFERSPAYHARVCADLLECRTVLVDERLRQTFDARIAIALQALSELTHPDGAVSLMSDGGMHMTYAPTEIAAVGERVCKVRAVPRAHITLESAGYYGWRKDKTYFLFDCGTIGADRLPVHGHGDALSFEWTLHGERVIVDAGVFEYRSGAMRSWSRGTRAHNTVTLDDRDQCEFVASFRVGRRARVKRTRLQLLPDGIIVEGTHDGYAHLAGAPLHRRLVRATTTDIHIEDRIEGGARQAVCARLLCHPSARVTQSKDGVVTINQGRVALRIVSESPITLENSWWCPDFGLRLATKQIVVHYGTAPRVGSIHLRSLVTAPAEMVPSRPALARA